jgi:cyclase
MMNKWEFRRIGPVMLALVLMAGHPGCASRTAGLDIREVDPQLTIVLERGANSAIFAGEDEVFVVDTKLGKGAEQLRAMVAERAAGRDITIINTRYHFDHLRGNRLYPDARVITGGYTQEQWKKGGTGSEYPDVVVEDTLVLDLGSERIVLMDMGAAHTWHDMVVWYQERRVLMTGDLVFEGRHPVLLGAHTGKWQAILERLIAAHDGEEITLVPGHGPVGDISALERMRDYFTDIRAALDDKAELKALRKRYKDYKGLPFFVSFNRTVKVMRGERVEP